eukprot:Hpha_TRINITY_DN9624_c0_g1::TRINITY_DN9624_c0_g1_i1::g.184485::m.184485
METDIAREAQRHELCAQHIRAALQGVHGADSYAGHQTGSLSPQGPRLSTSVPRSPPPAQYGAASPHTPTGAVSPHVVSPHGVQSPHGVLSPHGGQALSIAVAAQLHGEKRNLKFRFAGPPPLEDLIAGINAVFGIESRATRMPTQPHVLFKLTVLKVYDPSSSLWLDCLSSAQLTHGAQLYALQQDTEAGTVLPTPDDALFWAPSVSAPPQVVVEFGVVPQLMDRSTWVFNSLDTARKGYITQEDLSAGVNRCGMQVHTDSLFRTIAGGSATLSQVQWIGAVVGHKFGKGLVDSLFFRGHDVAAARNVFRAEMTRIH